jgi:hypothetical protein
MALANFTAGFLEKSNESAADTSQGLEGSAIAVEGRETMLAACLAVGSSTSS